MNLDSFLFFSSSTTKKHLTHPVKPQSICMMNKLEYCIIWLLHVQAQLYLLMDFKQRFQGKMTMVDKRGLKHTILDMPPLPAAMRTQQHRYTKSITRQPEGLAAQERQTMRRKSTYHGEIAVRAQKELLSTHTSSEYGLQPFLKRSKMRDECFLDQMLEKHKNLLSIIDRKSSYRGS